MERPRALLTSASSRPPPSAHARSPPARRPRRSGFPHLRPGPAPPPGGGGGGCCGGRVVLAAALAAEEPTETQRLTSTGCGGPTDRVARDRETEDHRLNNWPEMRGLTDAQLAEKSEPWGTLGIREFSLFISQFCSHNACTQLRRLSDTTGLDDSTAAPGSTCPYSGD
ncbi:protein-L-isoaspartate O-methyltransferase domain-containing protein 1 isoform X3 [Bubalus kerabau]|uniref:protein-L-isoaspartate O-methyltransferase domain-containing protein 1 isoform X3 n=1 Tax=Bubalus carabanensis TaxID=3119969 RepID=UPI00244E6B9D|nr:protein-L-isoaspartate O-methyltransferase domain-containing protein 1 isoform X3 [Bubalus carabanensis]